MAIIDEVWLTVASLRDARTKVSRANFADLGGFNKAWFFRSCLRNPNTTTRNYSVGGLTVTPRIIAYIVIWLLTPHGFNHVVLTEDDLILMYCLVNKIKVNWVSIIKEQLVRIKKKAKVSHSICCTVLELYRIL